ACLLALAVIALGHRPGQPRLDDGHRGLDAMPGAAPLPRRDRRVARVQADDLAEALVVGDAVHDEAVHVSDPEAGVVQRPAERPHAEIIGVVLRELAVGRRADADDGGAPAQTLARHDGDDRPWVNLGPSPPPPPAST